VIAGGVTVVTGAASGIGAACVRAARERGSSVVAVDRAPVEAAEGVTPVQLDVGDAEAVAALGDQVRAVYGRCDVLICSAGIAPVGNATDCTVDEWDAAFAVNARGTWLCCRALLDLLAEGDGGAIVTIASGAGLRPHGDLAAYSASKAAVIALTRSMALAYGPRGVRVNCVAPGVIDTPLNDAVVAERGGGPAALEALVAGTALRRVGRPEDVAATVAFLAGADAALITGSTVVADGGRVLH
jgi:NAD(P)-dependent dehydrogenase (short-subunit alcohol dehydrogenase family)